MDTAVGLFEAVFGSPTAWRGSKPSETRRRSWAFFIAAAFAYAFDSPIYISARIQTTRETRSPTGRLLVVNGSGQPS